MTTKAEKIAQAAGLSLALAGASGAAHAEGSDVHGWDFPERAEHVMQDVTTHFTTGEPPVVRDVHVDCDLLVKDGEARHLTTGFTIQFNAETQRTYDIIGPQNMQRLQAWVGQTDYRASTVKGTVVHLEGAHRISRDTLRNAWQICQQQFPDHGIDINQIGSNLEGIHPDYVGEKDNILSRD